MLNLSVKCSHFRFEFAEGQNTKIQSKYQNSFQAQNAKISAVSTPILTAKAAFFRIFQALSEKYTGASRKRVTHTAAETLRDKEQVCGARRPHAIQACTRPENGTHGMRLQKVFFLQCQNGTSGIDLKLA